MITRLLVAMTRPKRSLVVVGDSETVRRYATLLYTYFIHNVLSIPTPVNVTAARALRLSLDLAALMGYLVRFFSALRHS